MRRTVLLVVLAALVGALVAVPIAVYASHQFTDVSNSNTFHADIAWLADAGVTKGCNPPANTQFCPKDNVTREQMAAFMHRLGTTQVVDAGELGGYQAEELAPRAAFNATNDAPDGPANPFRLTAEINAPAPGLLLMSGGVDGFNITSNKAIFCNLRVDNSSVTGTDRTTIYDGSTGVDAQAACNTSGATAVSAGTHTVELTVTSLTTDVLLDASVWAIWVPFDGQGN